MLIEFSVANYRSFRELSTLSMVAANLKAKHGELDVNNVFDAPGKIRLLHSAAIYGANASGKSNLIAAINFMRRFVLNSPQSTRRTGGIPADPFRLSTETTEEPSHFEVVFVLDEQRYRYGFEVTEEQVEAEWLYTVPTVREAKLFEREGDSITLGERFKEGREISDKTRPNALFLSVVAQFNGTLAQKILSWFRSCTIVAGLSDQGIRLYTQQRLLDNTLKEEIVQLVRRLDLGIDDIRIDQRAVSLPGLPVEMPEELRTVLEPMLTLAADGEQVVVQTVHRRFDETGSPMASVTFDLDEHESEGTKKLFALSGPLMDTLKHGKVLIIDELDARLHPLLMREIVKLFNDPEVNPHHAQLVFTTQDTNLLDNRLLRRDQIWFIEKDRQGASHLYSLAEFKVRNDALFEKEYIQGRYGAVPFLGGLRQVIEDAKPVFDIEQMFVK